MVNFLPAIIKSINPIQKYIIESYACILKIFVIMFLLINALISLGICSIPKEL